MNDEEDFEPQYVKDERAKQNKFADFMVGFFVIGSFILIICIYTGIIDMGLAGKIAKNSLDK